MVTNAPSVAELLHNGELQRLLETFHLDWRSRVYDRLSMFALGDVTRDNVDAWLKQFDRLGDFRSVGEHLLQLVDLVPLAELGASLGAGGDFYAKRLTIGFNQDAWGKSWGIVSTLVKKICPEAQIMPISQAIDEGCHPNVIRLIEDGLFSGTEMIAIFDSLRGTRKKGRTQKVRRLRRPKELPNIPIQLFFGVVCDFGVERIRDYLAKNSLPNVQIEISSAARRLRVLDGVVDEIKTVNDDSPQQVHRSMVAPFAFHADRGWLNEALRSRAKSFCEEVGEQLWRNYLSKKDYAGDAWPAERVRRCALGMDGLGLMIAFPHSVPKASLPLLWASGRVGVSDRVLDWCPLFPCADN